MAVAVAGLIWRIDPLDLYALLTAAALLAFAATVLGRILRVPSFGTSLATTVCIMLPVVLVCVENERSVLRFCRIVDLFFLFKCLVGLLWVVWLYPMIRGGAVAADG